jgi:hypothetical protein
VLVPVRDLNREMVLPGTDCNANAGHRAGILAGSLIGQPRAYRCGAFVAKHPVLHDTVLGFIRGSH